MSLKIPPMFVWVSWDLIFSALSPTTSIGFDQIVGERIYELYANSFMNDSRPQGWRRIGAVLANPTTPNGTLKVNSVSNGNVNLGIQNIPTDDSSSIKGVGNVFF